MTMTPQELERMNKLENLVMSLVRAENVPFIESLTRRLADSFDIPEFLNDLRDVDAPAPTNGQVLKYTTSGDDRWVAGTDNV